MTKFRKKPVVIEAVQYTGYNYSAIKQIFGDTTNRIVESPVLEPTEDNPSGVYLQINTLEGVMIAALGDWIIKGIKGELYPCKPDIFDATYEKVSNECQ